MTHRYVLTPGAQRDLNAIEDHTFDRFGLAQALALSEAMHQVFADLADQPLMGHVREDLSPTGRPFRYWTVKQRFMIVYEPAEQGIVVARIFDGSQNVHGELSAQSDSSLD